MEIKLLRMQSGEEVIAEMIKEGEYTYTISNPIVMVPGQDGNIGFATWCPFASKEVKDLVIRASYVVFVTDPKRTASRKLQSHVLNYYYSTERREDYYLIWN